MLDNRFSLDLDGFRLVARGSLVRNIALKGAADLDVDIILPQYYHSKEKMDAELKLASGRKDPYSPYYNLSRALFAMIDPDINDHQRPSYITGSYQPAFDEPRETTSVPMDLSLVITRRGHEAFTRSIKCLLMYHGMPVELDLFPKLLDKDGKIWWIGKDRKWVCPPATSFPAKADADFEPLKDLTDEAKATILFLKFWKKQAKKSCETKLDNLLFEAAKNVIHRNHPVAQTQVENLTDAEILAQPQLQESSGSAKVEVKDLERMVGIYEEIKSFHIAICVEKVFLEFLEIREAVIHELLDLSKKLTDI